MMKRIFRTRWFVIALVSLAAHGALAMVPLMHLPEPRQEQVLMTVSLRPAPPPEPRIVQAPPPPEAPPDPEPPPTREPAPPRKVAKVPAARKAPVTHEVDPLPTVPEPIDDPVPAEAEPVEVAQAPAQEPVPEPPPAVVEAPGPEVDVDAYLGRLASSIERHKRYPRQARVMGMEGVVVVSVKVTRTGGKVGRIEVVRSSGFDLLDREAMRMVNAAAFPAAGRLPSDPFPMHIPVRFAIASR